MYASSPDELKKRIEENADEFPSTFIADDSFAFYCYTNYSYMDLKELFEEGQVDRDTCSEWNISEDEWKAGVEMALMVHYHELMG